MAAAAVHFAARPRQARYSGRWRSDPAGVVVVAAAAALENCGSGGSFEEAAVGPRGIVAAEQIGDSL